MDELDDVAYLRDLAERLRRIPAAHGTDGYDVDRLGWIATTLAKPVEKLPTDTSFIVEIDDVKTATQSAAVVEVVLRNAAQLGETWATVYRVERTQLYSWSIQDFDPKLLELS